MARKTIAEQIIEFVKTNTLSLNSEKFSTLEFVIQGGNLDGCRIKKYIKAKKQAEGSSLK